MYMQIKLTIWLAYEILGEMWGDDCTIYSIYVDARFELNQKKLHDWQNKAMPGQGHGN